MIREIVVSSFEDYIRTFKEQRKQIWFRGVKNHTFGLTPGAVRFGLSPEQEETIVTDFIREYQNYHSFVSNPWEVYSLMQHYGLPTRLLDWSSSMLVALFFALEGDADKDEKGRSIDRAVWVMSSGAINKLSYLKDNILPTAIGSEASLGNLYLPKPLRHKEQIELPVPQYPLALQLPYTNKRIRAQKGCFTVHGSLQNSLEEVMEKQSLNNSILKIRFDSVTAWRMREALFRLQINEDDIYQDLNSLSRKIIRNRGLFLTEYAKDNQDDIDDLGEKLLFEY